MRPLEARDPARIAHYRPMCVLGTGGMGRVFLAQGPGEEYVALKVAHETLAAQHQYRVRFAREVAALMRVDGLCTAQVHDFDVAGPTLWVAMDYVPGPTLGGLVRRTGPLSPHTGTLLAIGLAEALESIHAAGLIHRDLKPGNVIMSSAGPRVVDFGVARAVDSTPLTHAGQVLGTVGWMAPEQLEGAEESPATDMFAWAAVVHYAVTGRHPFGGGRAETVALRVRHEQPDLRGLAALDPALRGFLARALDRDPARRPGPGEVIRTLLGIPRSASPAEIEAALSHTFTAWPAGAAARGVGAPVRAGVGAGAGAGAGVAAGARVPLGATDAAGESPVLLGGPLGLLDMGSGPGLALTPERAPDGPPDEPPEWTSERAHGRARLRAPDPVRRGRVSALLAASVMLLGAGTAAASIAAHPAVRAGAAPDSPVAGGAPVDGLGPAAAAAQLQDPTTEPPDPGPALHAKPAAWPAYSYDGPAPFDVCRTDTFPNGTTTLRRGSGGSRGDAAEGLTIRSLQAGLRSLNYGRPEPIPVTGDFGPLTEQAVRSFQRRHDLAVSGAVDAELWAVLHAAVSAYQGNCP